MAEDGTAEGGLLFELYNMMSSVKIRWNRAFFFFLVVADNNSWSRDHVGIFARDKMIR